ncbi:hypothetical protein [Nostoc sp. DedSLP04]|nr:hypothetical protein [Nostoc sp. DedSLP04]MDZ8036067.1 hypothetical protein [Nostoc sp. DedSLP04]
MKIKLTKIKKSLFKGLPGVAIDRKSFRVGQSPRLSSVANYGNRHRS